MNNTIEKRKVLIDVNSWEFITYLALRDFFAMENVRECNLPDSFKSHLKELLETFGDRIVEMRSIANEDLMKDK